MRLNPGDEAFFKAAEEGRLVVKRCRSCGSAHHYPRFHCPFCHSNDLEWIESDGRGEIFTYSVTRSGSAAPYCIAYVLLDAGVLMLTNIVDCDLDAVRVGDPVKVVFRKSENGETLPMFVPADAEETK